MNYQLLLQSRSENKEVREGVLLTIEALVTRLSERYLVLLNDVIPFLSELLDDESEDIERLAKRIVSRIERITGESIESYLK